MKNFAMGMYGHLTPEDREQIAILHNAGWKQNAIAAEIGKSDSTVSRELRRNALGDGQDAARIADGSYTERRQKSATLERDARLGLFVRQRPNEGWSPQQTS